MINKISTIIFLLGILILFIVNIKIIHSKENYSIQQQIIMTSCIIISIIMIIGAWILREFRHNEKYGYDYTYQTGKLVGGTVYASYPENVGGLGWIL